MSDTAEKPPEPEVTSSDDVAPPEAPEVPENSAEAAEDVQEEVVVANEEIVEETAEEIAVVDGEEIIFADEDDYGIEYDAVVSLSNERNLLFEMYQPQETENGTYLCKICMRTGKNTEYPDRTTFVAHRYKCHGSFNNNVICPMVDCREVYASLYTLRRHLGQQHDLPLEIHQQSFQNIGEFEKFRHLVEITSGCRYMMHTKQPKYRRQVMHCAKSEHKLVLQTQKHRLPRERMRKEGSACPSVISYRVDASNGQVHTFMQLFHTGHAPDVDPPTSANSARPLDIIFPQKPACFAARAMQYVQIDVHEMPTAVYGRNMYESILVVTCLKTRFMWAKPLQECTRTNIGRILNGIFNEFGVPEGFSTIFSPTYIRDAMRALESVYVSEIKEIWSEPPLYSALELWVVELSEHELETRNRWVEQLQFVVMEYNQKALDEHDVTPFERMFQRKPPNLYLSEFPEDDELSKKLMKCHEELRREEGQLNVQLSTFFLPGDKVFLRKGITKPCRGNNTQFYFGYVSDRDRSNKYYQYKVHYSSNDSPWPSERNIFAWVSVFDLLPTTHKIREMPFEDRQETIQSLLCTCSGVESNKMYDLSAVGELARKTSKCVLFRNIFCANEMSRHCCKTEGAVQCRFHALYPEDESYTRMEVTLVQYTAEKIAEQEKPPPRHVAPPREAPREKHVKPSSSSSSSGAAPPPVAVEMPEIQEDDVEVDVEIDVEETDDVAFEYTEKEKEKADLKRKAPPAQPKMKEKEEVKRKKVENPTSSAPEVQKPAEARRLSGRKTIRPKILDDYVE